MFIIFKVQTVLEDRLEFIINTNHLVAIEKCPINDCTVNLFMTNGNFELRFAEREIKALFCNSISYVLETGNEEIKPNFSITPI